MGKLMRTAAAVCLVAVGALPAVAVTTAGWENIDPNRKPLAPARVVWRADFAETNAFEVVRIDGAEGRVSFAGGRLTVRKTNARGLIVIKGPVFRAERPDQALRFAADVSVDGAETEYSHATIRAVAEDGTFPRDPELGCGTLVDGGAELMRGLVNSPPGVFYRKYAHGRARDGRCRLAILVSGFPSVSVWREWTAEDLEAAQAKWQTIFAAKTARDRSAERIPDAAFEARLSSDADHTAAFVRTNGCTRLLVDGRVVPPHAYQPKHSFGADALLETFAGKPVLDAGVPLAVKAINTGTGAEGRHYWTERGFDAAGAVRDIRDSMRIAPDALYVVGFSVNAYPDFTLKEHPDEVWIRENGEVVRGTSGSCIEGYDDMGIADTNRWPWVSYASPSWRAAVRANIGALVGELKRTGLSRRVVGIHLRGYHDAQMYAPYVDLSPCAQAAYRRFLAAGAPVSTNYLYFSKQLGQMAMDEFAGEFKRAMGKPTIAIRWCDSALCGSQDLETFVASENLDVIVPQPWYPRRHPGIPSEPKMPFSTFARRGKMLWTEFDFRTYGALESWASSVVATKGLGQSDDLAYWQTNFRKYAGTMLAARSGWWFYDMASGFYDPPEIAADIGAVMKVSRMLAERGPSAWRPGVAVVFDQAGTLSWDGVENPLVPLLVPMQLCLLSASGVPYEFFLAEDVMSDPSVLDGARTVFLANFRKYDARRTAFVRALRCPGRTIVHMAESGVLGGAEAALGIKTTYDRGRCDHCVEPADGVPDEEAASVLQAYASRDLVRGVWPAGSICGPRGSLVETPDLTVMARYAQDGKPALAFRTAQGCREYFVCEAAGMTPQLANRVVRESGAYAPVSRGGVVQVDMNGDFASVHALKNGPVRFVLPFPCRVTNLKSFAPERTREGGLDLELTAGETVWLGFER